MSVEYKESWFIVPMRIMELEGLTLGYLKVYQTIFEFWNKHQPCFLSNPKIEKRTGLKPTQIKEALNFFEKAGELERQQIGIKRYLKQPTRRIETEIDNYNSANINQQAAPPATSKPKRVKNYSSGRSTDPHQAAPPATEIKNLNKEVRTHARTLFVQYKISIPSDEVPLSEDIISIGIIELKKHDLSLEAYLCLLQKHCSNWINEPWKTHKGKWRMNGYEIIMKPMNIRKAINGEFRNKDK